MLAWNKQLSLLFFFVFEISNRASSIAMIRVIVKVRVVHEGIWRQYDDDVLSELMK